MNDITFTILKVIISIAAALITIYVIPYLSTLKEDKKYAALLDMVKVAVHAAEQTITEGGVAKKAEVMQFVTDWMNANNIKVTQEQLSQLVEAAVYSMNAAKGK